jgi:hypothetical protein
MGDGKLSRFGSPTAAAVGLLFVAMSVGACGGAAHVRQRPIAVHLDGHATGDYVREISATGVGFLVPTSVLAEQKATSFDVVSPRVGNSSGPIQIGPAFKGDNAAQTRRAARHWMIGSSITGVTPQRAHVELLVTGDPGQRIYLNFQESCGLQPMSKHSRGETSASGAAGQSVVRTPAVMNLPGLRTGPVTRCAISGMVVNHPHHSLHLGLLDY